MNLHDLRPRTVDQPGDRVRVNNRYPDHEPRLRLGTVLRVNHYIIVDLDVPCRTTGPQVLAKHDELEPA